MASLPLSSNNACFVMDLCYHLSCTTSQESAKMDYMCYEEGFMYELMTYCTNMHCHTVQFIFRLFVRALGFKAMKINTFVLDHRLILLNDFILIC